MVAELDADATAIQTSGIDSTYDEYEIHLQNVVPAIGASTLWLRTSTNAGSTFDTTNYAWTVNTTNSISAWTGVGNNSDAKIALANPAVGVGSGADNAGVSGVIRLIAPSSSASNMQVLYQTAQSDGTNFYSALGAGWWASTTAVNAIRFLFSSGNISSGLFKLYGVRKSV